MRHISFHGTACWTKTVTVSDSDGSLCSSDQCWLNGQVYVSVPEETSLRTPE